MGLLDDIYCKMPLPEDAPEFLKKCPAFQTYDLGRGMGEYIITEDGQLMMERHMLTGILMEAFGATEDPPPMPVNYKRKRIEMHGSNIRGGGHRNGEYVWYTNDGSDYIEITYVVQIRNGKVSSIKEKNRTTQPARPFTEM